MAYVKIGGNRNLGSGSPTLTFFIEYDMRRNVSTQEYRLRASFLPVTGQYFYRYLITVDISLDGTKIMSGANIQGTTPDSWSSNLV